jgi:hypothetical protein
LLAAPILYDVDVCVKVGKHRFHRPEQIREFISHIMFVVSLASLIVIAYKAGAVISPKEETILELVATTGDRLIKSPDNHFLYEAVYRLFFVK